MRRPELVIRFYESFVFPVDDTVMVLGFQVVVNQSPGSLRFTFDLVDGNFLVLRLQLLIAQRLSGFDWDSSLDLCAQHWTFSHAQHSTSPCLPAQSERKGIEIDVICFLQLSLDDASEV